jgi:uncharacterized membrane protein
MPTRTRSLLAAAGLGGGLAYFLDPACGRDRREAVRNAFSSRSRPRGYTARKSITILAPVEDVFALLSNPGNFPAFTDVVPAVRLLADGHYQKVLSGPLGLPIITEEVEIDRVENEFVAWKSTPFSPLHYSKSIRFTPLAPTRTRIEFSFTYNPPGGLLGHLAGSALGMNPKPLLQRVLSQAKRYLEAGDEPDDTEHDGAPELAESESQI